MPGIINEKEFVKVLDGVGKDKFKVRTNRFGTNISDADIKDSWMSLKRKGWNIGKAWDSSLPGFNEIYVCEKVFNESLDEDTIKQNGKWVNKGKEGTHGTFKTKKEADAQRKAMFAQGYKESLSNDDPDKYDELVNKVFDNIKPILHDEKYKKDLSKDDLEYLGKLISKKYFTEGLQDIQNDFTNARKNWDSLGFNISFDDALDKLNELEK